MDVIETIDRLVEQALSKPFRRKAEACFLLASRIAPFYGRWYALASGGNWPPFSLRDHILFLWTQYCVGSPVSAQNALRLESHIPHVGKAETPDSRLADYAESAGICALHLTWYLARRDDGYVKGCVINYFDHIDCLVRDGLDSIGAIPELTDLLVARSRLFVQEVNDFENALIKEDREAIASRPLLIANMDRDMSKYV
jgi:hypothetical protein